MRRLTGLVLLIGLVTVAFVASIALGARVIPVEDVWTSLRSGAETIWQAAIHLRPPEITKTSDTDGIVWDLRVPRTLLGLFVGAAVGAAGAVAQGHTRNPLADPGMLGVNAGAACAVVTGVYVFGIQSPLAFMVFGLIGAIIAASAVFGLAAISGASPLTLILAGTGLSAMLLAITSAIVLTDSQSLDSWRFWNVGATAGRGMDVFWASVPFIVVGLVIALASGFFLNALSLGDDMARSLGSSLILVRLTGIIAITLLVGAGTAACGPIVFLGLLVPHMARAFVGADYRWIIPYSALFGALLMLACDVVGRIIARPQEVQVGVVLAFVGAPFLIALIRRQRLAGV